MKNILITGLPRVGKTTLITTILEELKKKAIGFVTEEIRENNMRIGFELKTISGQKLLLASKRNTTSRYRVASYGVYLENVDSIIDSLSSRLDEVDYDLIIVDEIGKMELFSSKFKMFVMNCLEKKKVLGTIMIRDNDFTRQIKRRNDTILLEITVNNREKVKNKIMELLI